MGEQALGPAFSLLAKTSFDLRGRIVKWRPEYSSGAVLRVESTVQGRFSTALPQFVTAANVASRVPFWLVASCPLFCVPSKACTSVVLIII